MKSKLEKIFCAIDFSDYTNLVLHYGIGLAQAFNARLLIFHSVYSPKDQLYGTTLFERGGERERLMTDARDAIEQLMRTCPVPWKSVVRSGDPVQVTARVARELDVDMVVAASREFSGIKRMLIGTVVERLARIITRPLLVVRSGKRQTISEDRSIPWQLEQIAVGSNLSTDAELAVEYAWHISRAAEARLELVHAMESPLDEDLISPTQGPYQAVQDELQNRLRRRLIQQIPGSIHQDETLGVHLDIGLPGEVLLDYIRHNHPDMVVVGVRHRGTVGKLLIGSTTEALLRRAPCPVLVIPDTKDDDFLHRLLAKHETVHKTGIVKDNCFLKHDTGRRHPENRSRLKAVYSALEKSELLHRLVSIQPRAARREELLWLHTPEYVNQVATTAGKDHCSLTADTSACADSYATARLAVGGLFEAIERVVAGDLVNAFALVRPPGHHAERGRAMGFCLFNNIALGAVYAQKQLGLEKVLIVDWDVHHGNGTQHFFEDDPTVLFFSVHQHPHVPGTGVFTETGRGAGEGYTINIPLPRGWGDGELIALLEEVLRPVAMAFQPEIILVSAGFDTHIKDPLGAMYLTSSGFAGLTRALMELASECCQGKLVLCLEGGYHKRSLANSVMAVLKELSNETVSNVAELAAQADQRKLNHVLKRCIPVHHQFWSSL
jgi:acetoin utilization deacetylase AcuC-like enzyme/nucleotide-binding universal stress UspA family protein